MTERPTIRDVAARAGVSVATEAAGLSHPPLTTIRQDRDALGARAANQLLEMIEHPDAPPAKELLPVELVVRASSGAAVSTAGS